MDSKQHTRTSNLLNAARNGQLKPFTDLIQQGHDPHTEGENGTTALHTVCVSGKYLMVRYLCKKYPDLIGKNDYQGDTALHYASAGGHVHVLKFLVDQKSEMLDINCRNKNGESVLHKACLYGNSGMVEYLTTAYQGLEKETDKTDWNILHYAAAGGDITTFSYLTEKLRMPSVEDCMTESGRTVSHIACMRGKTNIVKYFVRKFPILKNKKDNEGFTLLHAAVFSGDIDLFKFLVNQGLDIKQVTTDGWTILHIACLKGNQDMVNYIVNTYTFLATVEDDDGYLATHFAAVGGHTEIFKFLVRQGVNKACSQGVDDIVRLLDKVYSDAAYLHDLEQTKGFGTGERSQTTAGEELPVQQGGLNKRTEEVISSFIHLRESFEFPPDAGSFRKKVLQESFSSKSSGYVSRTPSTRSEAISRTPSTRSQAISENSSSDSASTQEQNDYQIWPDDTPFSSPSKVHKYIKEKGNKSYEVKLLLQWFCMRAKSKFILHHQHVIISPGYHADNPNELILLAIVKKDPGHVPNTSDSFKLVVRKEGVVSTEGKFIVAKEGNKHFTMEEHKKIKNCLNKNSKELMRKHSNLEIVSASKFKSTNFGKDGAHLKEETCIALYVHVKGIIPFQEEPFPEEIDGFTVDVREGLFEPHVLPEASQPLPEGYHEKLVMGCTVSSAYGSGTLGGFVDLKNGKIGALTCLHVFLSEENKEELKKTRTLSHGSFKREVYQPYSSMESLKVGIVTKEVFHPGDEKEGIGVEAALIEITNPDRLPVNGHFPDATSQTAGFSKENPMVFSSGNIFKSFKEVKRNCRVSKYGSATGHTTGMLKLAGSHVHRRRYAYAIGANSSEDFELSDQFEIHHFEDEPFSCPGDSGSLVFLVDHKNGDYDIRALGMLVGGTSNNTSIVTPIWAVLKKFDLPSRLKRFEDSENSTSTQTESEATQSALELDVSLLKQEVSGLKAETSTMHRKLDDLQESVDTKMDDVDNKIENVNTELQVVKSGIQQVLQVLQNTDTNNLDTKHKKDQ